MDTSDAPGGKTPKTKRSPRRPRAPAGEAGGEHSVEAGGERSVEAGGERSVAVGGDATNAIIVTGDHGQVIVHPPGPVRMRLTRATWRAWLAEQLTLPRVGAGLAAAIGLAAAVITMVQFGLPYLNPPARMGGSLNIAVADFAVLNAASAPAASPRASSLAGATAAGLQQALGGAGPGNLGVEVWDPGRTHRVAGATRVARARAAGALARQIDADVIVYGDVTMDAAATTLTPEFYLSDARLGGAEELAGEYELGSPIISDGDFERNPATFNDLRDRLLTRTQGLAEFIFGMGSYTRRDLAQADRAFSAADSPAWDDRDGKEVLYLFRGSTAGLNNDLVAARRYYERALAIRPGYARALLGLAEVEFQAAGPTQDCDPSRVDAALLRKAADDLAAVSSAPLQPAVSNVPEKTAYLRGRVDLCLSQAGLEDRFDAARRELQTVIASFEGGKTALQDYAAEAHAAIGLIAFPEAGETNETVRAAAYRAAIDEYLRAANLSKHRERQAEFWTMIGYLRTRVSDPEAEAAYARGLELDPANRARNEALRRSWEQPPSGG